MPLPQDKGLEVMRLQREDHTLHLILTMKQPPVSLGLCASPLSIVPFSIGRLEARLVVFSNTEEPRYQDSPLLSLLLV